MAQLSIFGPVFVLMLLTWLVWIYLYIRRIPFINSLDLAPDEITPSVLAERSPPAVNNPSDNLKNLFEVPVLFYVLAIYLFGSNQVDGPYVVGAWLYVLLRIVHSLVHCTVNMVMLRFVVYAMSCVVLIAMTMKATS